MPVPVSPRYLAGPGHDLSHAFTVLIDKRGWPHHHHDEEGNHFVHSPCTRVTAAFLGDHLRPWQIRVSAEPMEEPAWFGAFDGSTPPEIVAAVLETLADTLEHLPDQLTANRSPYTKEATRTLEQAGWDKTVDDTHTTLTPPGGRARLAGLSIQRHPHPWQGEEFEPYAETTTLWGGPKDSGAHWDAVFTRDTPLHLVAAVTRSLITPAPVLRHPEDLDPAVLPHLSHQDGAGQAQAAATRARLLGPAAPASAHRSAAASPFGPPALTATATLAGPYPPTIRTPKAAR
ncbi:DUF317 domain-containing protein [Kitasatospora sp. NPDC001574]